MTPATRTVKLIIAFQGTRYFGWQSQKNDKTLQELFERILHRILQEKTNLHSSSRTDSGVHARGLVAHFKTRAEIPDKKLVYALNYYLPDDVTVLSAKTVPADFHARFHAKHKTYEYRLWNSRTKPSYADAPFVLWCPFSLDVARMRRAAKHLLGKHDFSAFQDNGDDDRDPVKRVLKISFVKKGADIRIRVTGEGFLRHMVRIIAGTLLDIGRGKTQPEDIRAMIQSKDRKKAGPTSKAQGLTLLKVTY